MKLGDLVGKPVKFNKKTRFCKFSECKKQLSIYNHSDYCFSHQFIGALEEEEGAKILAKEHNHCRRPRKKKEKQTVVQRIQKNFKKRNR